LIEIVSVKLPIIKEPLPKSKNVRQSTALAGWSSPGLNRISFLASGLIRTQVTLSHIAVHDIKPKTALINVSAALSPTEMGLALSIFVDRIWDVSMSQYLGL
jgi:hypothetical protein